MRVSYWCTCELFKNINSNERLYKSVCSNLTVVCIYYGTRTLPCNQIESLFLDSFGMAAVRSYLHMVRSVVLNNVLYFFAVSSQ